MACNSNDTDAIGVLLVASDEPAQTPNLFWVGVILSIFGETIIAVSLSVQKIAHNANKGPDGEPLKAFVYLPLWWVGIACNLLGEIGNLAAYGMAPTAVVAPVGSIGVVANQVLAVMFLKEPFRRRDVVGIACTLGGVVCILLAVPEEGDKPFSVGLLLSDEYYLSFRTYALFAVLAVVIGVLSLMDLKDLGRRWMLVLLLLAASISSVTVMACRGFSGMATQIFEDCASLSCCTASSCVDCASSGRLTSCAEGELYGPCMQTIGTWLFWVLLAVIALSAVWSTAYLSKAMVYYGSSEVVPVYYCSFTLISITGSAIVYNELKMMDFVHSILFAVGLVLSLVGVGILMSGRKKQSSSEETSSCSGGSFVASFSDSFIEKRGAEAGRVEAGQVEVAQRP